MTSMLNLKRAACVIITDGINALAVNRKSGATALAFPGGKVDEGETFTQTALRELQEETGLVVSQDDLMPVYGTIVYGKDNQHYFTMAFLYTGTLDKVVDYREMETGIVPRLVSVGDLNGDTEIERYNFVAMLEVQQLIDQVNNND